MSMLAEQVSAIIDKTLPRVSNLANVSALLNTLPNINWCGFYLVEGDKLFLGPFQGEPACTVIPRGRGVCGTAFEKKRTVVVPDVSKFPGHIACSAKSRSEIVVPVIKRGAVVAVIDIDAPIVNRFGDEEREEIEKVAEIVASIF